MSDGPKKTINKITKGFAKHGYICSDQISTAVYLASELEKPILIEGPPGVGKTELANTAAMYFKKELVRLQCYEGLDESKALYEWRYGKQLLYTQILKEQMQEVLEGAKGLKESLGRLMKFEDIFFSEDFLETRPLLKALSSEKGTVLLIDEVDKSDEEFEALLLEILSEFQISIPELGVREAKVKPLVMLTSNNSREIGDALKRRCLHLYIPFPDAKLERQIVQARVPEISESMQIQLVNFVQGIRELDLKKQPAMMEKVLTDFVKALRNSNVRVSPAETLDAMSVIDEIGYDDRDLLKRSLSIVLPKTPHEKEKFETCFDDFFTDEIKEQVPISLKELKDIDDVESDLAKNLLQGSQAELMIAIADAAEAAEIREIRYFTQRSVFTRRILEKMGVGKLEDELMQIGSAREEDLPTDLEQELRNQLTGLRERVSDYVQQQFLLHGDVSGEQLREQVFKTMNMAQIDRSYLHEVHSLVRRMAKKLANLHSRRKKNFRRGKLDIRKTLRENWVNQGVLFNLSWAYKKVDRPKIYVICDVSGSVGAYARFMLMFLFSLTEVVSKLRAFVFSSNLGEVTDEFKDSNLDVAIETALQKHGGGSTDYGQALTDFVSLCIDEIDKKTTVVILGDARNNFGPEKAHLMKIINERSKQVFWLNPEGKYRWDTGDSVMTTYSAYCTKVFQCGNNEQLERVISTLLKTAI